MLTLIPNGDRVNINAEGALMGSVCLYDNPCHKQNRYVKLNVSTADPSISAELFQQLHNLAERPLQVMIDSEDIQTANFLTAGGFICKRKCYEVEAEKEDWLGTAAPALLQTARKGTDGYELCCQLMYDYYTETHKEINPWTAGYLFFLEALPDEVLYETVDGEIANLAFVDGSEIAYLHSRVPTLFPGFAAALVEELFSFHETICFESDDCDPTAMELRAMFANQTECSFDAYIYE